ncbi:MAG TPA: mercury transporter MerT [Methylosinus sp.]
MTPVAAASRPIVKDRIEFFSCACSDYGVQDSRTFEERRAMTIDGAARETTPAVSASPVAPTAAKWFAASSLVAGLGAVLASSCCAIPLAIAALGAGAGVLGGLETVAAWRAPLLFISAAGIVGGWGAWWLRRPPTCFAGPSCASRERSRATLLLLLGASASVLAAASWSTIDPLLLALFRGH